MSPQPVHLTIAAALRDAVVRGELAVGEPIPSEAQLCRQWGVSRGPVRQALARLRAEGVIGGGPGRPPVVRSRALPQSFETFLSFSRWATELGAVPGQRTLEIAKRPAPAEVADSLDLAPGTAVVQLVRLRLLDGRPAMLERTSFVEPVGRLLFDFDCDSGSVYSYLGSRGVDLGHARHLVDAVAAGPLDGELLGVAVGSPLLRERRLAGGAAGELVEYSDDRYLPGLVSFSAESRQDSPSPLLRQAATG